MKMSNRKPLAASLGLLLLPASASAVEWEPLITAAHFTGIRTDLLTAVAGFVTLLLIIIGVGLLYKVFH